MQHSLVEYRATKGNHFSGVKKKLVNQITNFEAHNLP